MNILTGVMIIAAAVYNINRRLYFRLSRYVLKPYFGIETPIYRKWHDRRAKKLQAMLDNEHSMCPTF